MRHWKKAIFGLTALLVTAAPSLAGPASGYPNATTPYAGTETVLGSEPSSLTTVTFPMNKLGLYALSLLSGDCVLNGSNKIVCTQTSGSPFGTFATANTATPPAIGTTTPNTAAFTTLNASGQVTFSSLTGSTQCLLVNSSGVVSASGSNCLTPSTAVTSFNTRVGAVSLTLGDVTGALTFTPAHKGTNSDITSLSGLTTALSVGQGGTGATTFAAHGVLLGEGASPHSATAAMSAGQVLLGQGTTSDPTPTTISGDATLSSSGSLTVTKTNGAAFGTAATQNIGTSGATIPLLNGANTYGAKQSYLPPSSSGAGVNVGQGVAPASPANGDLWVTSSGVFAQAGGNTFQLGGSTFGVNSWTSPGGTVQTGAVTMQSADVVNALAYTPLKPANNLSDLSNVATARTNLSLGTFATANAATPPAIGSTTPNSGSFTTLNATGPATAASFNGPLNGNVNGNASTATKLATARNISTSGDIACSAVAFDGSGPVTLPNCNLPSSGVGAGTYGDSGHVAQVTFDAKGRATGASSVAINYPAQLPSQSGNAGALLSTDGTNAKWATRASVYFNGFSGGLSLWGSTGATVTRVAAGCYHIDFGPLMPNANYTFIGTAGIPTGSSYGVSQTLVVVESQGEWSRSTAAVGFCVVNGSNSAQENDTVVNILVLAN